MTTAPVTAAAIALTAETLSLLHLGVHVHADDTAGRTVHLCPQGSTAPLGDRFDEFRAELSDNDLDLIGEQPEGLVVADVTRVTGWTVRVEGLR